MFVLDNLNTWERDSNAPQWLDEIVYNTSEKT